MRDPKYIITILKMTNCAAVAGALIWAMLLVKSAYHLSKTVGHAESIVSFGPLVLTRIARNSIDNGYTVSFSLENGLVVYIIGCLLLGMVVGIIVAYRIK